MSVRRTHGTNNQEGTLTPNISVWGQVYEHFAIPQLIDRPNPIGRQSHGFGGNVGGFVGIAASVEPLAYAQGYYGDLPNDQQPIVDAVDPWERP